MSILTEYDEQKTMNLFKEEGREEGREEAREEAWAAAVLSLLDDLGPVPDEIKTQLENITDIEELSRLLKAAARSKSFEEFEEVLPKEDALV